MSMRISPVIAQLGKLSIGGASRSIRFASTTTRTRTATTTTTKTTTTGKTEKPTTDKKPKKSKKDVKPYVKPLPPGHGENIFIFNHILQGMTVYSLLPVMKASRSLKQIVYHGKKLKPSKIRKDYWRPLAMIQFPEKQGQVGLNVLQRLMECKKIHEYAWGDDMLYADEGSRKTLTRRMRGRRLNDQRANTVADVAAVLGGLGKGNKIIISDSKTQDQGQGQAVESVGEDTNADADANTGTGTGTELDAADIDNIVATEDGKTLWKATVWWANPQDKNYAASWPANVSHQVFSEGMLVPTAAKKAELEAKEVAKEPQPVAS
ncbi:hypothetical protein GGS20DRAFT_587261 [Poronia punctata]|nr:hypothetical protein GGS20DRAFT_587261 [Poronia punctata]